MPTASITPAAAVPTARPAGQPDGRVAWGRTAGTRSGGALGALGLTIAALGLLTGNRPLVAVGVGALALTVLARLAVRGDVAVVATAAPASRVAVGSELSQRLVLRSAGALGPFRLRVVSRAAPGEPAGVASLAPGGDAELTLHRVAQRRGVEHSLTAVVERRDPLGLVMRRGTLVVGGDLVVHPRAVAVRPPARPPARRRPGLQPPEQTESGPLRPWRSGDGTRRVNWRASARTTGLLVLDEERTDPLPVALLVLVAVDTGDDLDAAVDLAAAVAVQTLPRTDVIVVPRLRGAAGRTTLDAALLLDLYAAAEPEDALSVHALAHTLEHGSLPEVDALWVAPTPRAAEILAPYAGREYDGTQVHVVRGWSPP